MFRAIYYLHTDIRTIAVLKNALLLWDSIDTIVPPTRQSVARYDLQRPERIIAEAKASSEGVSPQRKNARPLTKRSPQRWKTGSFTALLRRDRILGSVGMLTYEPTSNEDFVHGLHSAFVRYDSLKSRSFPRRLLSSVMPQAATNSDCTQC